jgi:hypothetical protein
MKQGWFNEVEKITRYGLTIGTSIPGRVITHDSPSICQINPPVNGSLKRRKVDEVFKE